MFVCYCPKKQLEEMKAQRTVLHISQCLNTSLLCCPEHSLLSSIPDFLKASDSQVALAGERGSDRQRIEGSTPAARFSR